MTTQDRNKTNPTGKPQQQQPRQQDQSPRDPSRSSAEPRRDSERR